jgi:sigma-B regulation protein RsbU (phosphoserine phosphatase)
VTEHYSLAPEGRSVSAARRLVEQAVVAAGLQDVLDEALLLVSELVTNAIVHAGTSVELAVTADAEGLRVEVCDRSPGRLPTGVDAPNDTREGGRGIFLLDALATEWGTRHFSAGKSVWFRLGEVTPTTPAPSPAGHVPAARRDLAWLVGLPADLEQQLGPGQLNAELLHRLSEALELPQSWLVAQREDDRTWELVCAHVPEGDGPDLDEVRRVAASDSDGVLSAGGPLVLPLRGNAGVFGAVVLAGAEGLDADDIALARLVGDRISVVLRDERSQASQLRSRGSLALLAEASEMFAGTLNVELAVTLAAQMVVPRFASWAVVATTYEHEHRLAAVAHSDEALIEPLRSALTDEAGQQMVAELVRSLGDRAVLVAPEVLPMGLGGETGEVLAVPLIARRRLLGILVVGRPSGGSYLTDDVGLLTDLARRAALAVDNARLYEERTSIAQALQASLLPPTLPLSESLEFGARYAAAGEGNDVGGDFYDVFSLVGRDGWGLAIGDVCGKGAEAAAITGMARDVLRLLTRDGVKSTEALRRLNDVILELGERSRFCTLALATVEPDGDGLLVRLSNAGHPRPVAVRADGAVEFVGRTGTVLGVVSDIDLLEDEIRLAPGDALVFYTDGVTERRRGREMFGDDNLISCLRSAAGGSADTLAGQLEQDVRQFGLEASRDDLAVLVLRCKVARTRPDNTSPLSGALPAPSFA